jgi:F-type H+-transporting ATPase subunit delta
MKLNQQLKQELKEYVTRRLHDRSSHVEVVSSYKLNDEEIDGLRKNISILEKAEITNSIDPSLLAGVIIKFGSKMIDLSIRGELQKLKTKLTS